LSVPSYRKPDIKTDFSSIPNWLYLIIAILLYGFGAFSFYDFISNPANSDLLDAISTGFNYLVPISLDFLPLFLVFIVVFLVITLILAYIIVWIMSKVAQEVTMIVSILFPLLMIGFGGLLLAGGTLTGDFEDTSGVLFAGIFLGMIFLF